MDLLPPAVHVCLLDIKRDEGGYPAWLCLAQRDLPALQADRSHFLHEREAAALTKLHERRHHSYLLGRYCAKAALARYTGIVDMRTLWLDRGVFDFPLVRGAESTHVAISLSHSAPWGCAVTFDERHPMGVDIQRVEAQNIAAAESQMTGPEKALSAPASLSAPFRAILLWTLKEALAKTVRTGLMTPLPVYEIDALDYHQSRWTATFKNFPQYRAVALILSDAVFALALPKNSRFDFPPSFAPAQPASA